MRDAFAELSDAEAQRMAALLAFEDNPAHAIAVATKEVALHPMAAAARKALLSDKPDIDWGAVKFDTGSLRVRVSPGGVPRAVKIVDALFKGLQARQFLNPAQNCVRVEGENLPISVEEIQRRVRHVPTPEEKAARKARSRSPWDEALDRWRNEPDWDFRPSNEFSVRYGSRVIARDGSQGSVEERLRDAPRALIRLAFEHKAQARAAEKRTRHLAELEDRRRKRLRLREIEALAAERLDKHARRWDAAERVRQFLTAVEAWQVAPELEEKRRRWLAWAQEHVASLNPLADPSAMFSSDLDEMDDLRADLGE